MDALDSTPWRVVLHFLDDVRLNFNRTFDYLEPWQIVLYTLSWVLLVQWLRKILKFEERSSFKKMWYELLLNIPLYRKNLEENKEATRKEIEERLLRFDRRKEFYKFLPDRGLSVDEILHEAVDYKTM
ncbi:sphingosine-1-phosphate lyase 1, partial [Aphelenchoides avenae]